jgi:hypothetical protein
VDPNKKQIPRYSGRFLLDREKHLAEIQNLAKVMQDLCKTAWAEYPTMYTALKEANKLAIKNGDTKPDLPGHQGHYFLNADAYAEDIQGNRLATNGRGGISVVDRNHTVKLRPEDGKPYPGCFVNAYIKLFTRDTPDRAINAQLVAVQFVRDGEAFVSAGMDENAFEKYGDALDTPTDDIGF